MGSTRRCAAPGSTSEAGADVIFVESPESEAELERIGREVSKPLLANMVEFGKTPRVEVGAAEDNGASTSRSIPAWASASRPRRCGRPGSISRTRAPASASNVPQYRGMHELMGFPEVWDFEKKWAP